MIWSWIADYIATKFGDKTVVARRIKENKAKLLVPDGIDPEALLWAVYYCERYTKHSREPRFEAAYAPGGLYYKNSEHVRKEYEEWGSSACCSYSNFQILYITACELGYTGPPLGLDSDRIALPYVVKYINERCFAKPGQETVEHVADAYNSGNHLDRFKPLTYIRRFRRFYDRELKRLEKERADTVRPNERPSGPESGGPSGSEHSKTGEGTPA